MIKLSDYVIRFIAGMGVKHIFILPGGGSMHLVDSLGKCKGLDIICNLHEQASAIAAEAYAQYTNNPGVAIVTTGPGGTNALTGVAGAWLDSIPCLFISGQVKRDDLIGNRGVRQMGNQEIDIVRIVSSITKYAVTVCDPGSIRYHMEKALYLAKNSRPGPVWIDIPLDVQAARIDAGRLKGFKPRETAGSGNKKIKGLVNKTIDLLNSSVRPVILAGNGVRLSGGRPDFLKLIERLQVPVLTTWKAIDFLPEDHPLFFGRPGAIGQRGANFIQQNADFIMTIGARLDLAQTGYNHKHFAPGAKKVIVDIDPAEIAKLQTKIDIPVCIDASVFIKELLKRIDKTAFRSQDGWLSCCKRWKDEYPVVLPQYYKQKKFVNTYVLIDILSRLLLKGDCLVPGSSGSCSEITLQAFKVKMGQRIINTPGLGAMGFGLPASIGVCLASGRKRTVGIIGDGGLQHNIQELETLKRLRLPVKLFILNNNGYASIRSTQKNYFHGHYVCCDPKSGLTIPGTLKIARAYGIKGVKITDQRNITARVRQVLEADGPILCEVMVDPHLATAPKMRSRVLPDGSIASSLLEDLWPFLKETEFKANMSVSTS